MPKTLDNPTRMRLVPDEVTQKGVLAATFPGTQGVLFPFEHPSVMAFLLVNEIRDVAFVSILATIKPKVVVDVRPVPTFDVGRLNRKIVFEMFEHNRVVYYDLAGMAGAYSRQELSPLVVAEILNALFNGTRNIGPVVFLLDNQELSSALARDIPKLLKAKPESGWQILH